MAEQTNARETAHVGEVRRSPVPISAGAAPDHTLLGESRESRLKNPLREICTVGSVRGECLMNHGGPKRARSWKRRIQPRNAYRSPGLLYSERCPLPIVSDWTRVGRVVHTERHEHAEPD